MPGLTEPLRIAGDPAATGERASGDGVRAEARDWALSVALANACLLRIWVDLLAHDPWPAHRDHNPPSAVLYAAACLLTVILGTGVWALLRSRVPTVWKVLALGAVSLLLLKEVYLTISGFGWIGRGSTTGLALIAVCALASTGVVYRYGVGGAWLARRAATVLLPLLAITFLNAAARAWQRPPDRTVTFDRGAAPDRTGPRVVWIILDEIDEQVAFRERPPGLRLPELDRFRAEASFAAEEAYSPANATTLSIPALLGANGPGEDSVFGRARQAGLRTGVVGWAVPYCQIFERTVESCAWWPMSQQHNSYGSSLPEGVRRMAISLLETNQFSPFGRSLAVQGYIGTVRAMSRAAQRMASRADLDFVYLHLPPPHNPYVYNPETKEMDIIPRSLPNAPGYLRNLLLADRVLGEIRQAMEKSGVWERSIVVVTGDHGFRSKALIGYKGSDRHVPLMIKGLHGQNVPHLSLNPKARLETEKAAGWAIEWLRPRS